MKRKYGLLTAIAMVVGIVIGSGIFFKSDNVLVATNGSVGLGVLVFCLAAVSIIFGSLSIAELAKRTNGTGGVVAYAEKFISRKIACGFGWFQTFMYYPCLTVVVGWVAGVYACMLFGIPSTLGNQIIVGLITIILLYVINILAPKLAGVFQISATAIKLFPLFFIAIAGLVAGNGEMEVVSASGKVLENTGWLMAIAPIAYTFDGWIVATSISQEIKNEKRNLPIAMILAPIFILGVYILYFVGITKMVGVDAIMASGDEHVYLAMQSLLGKWGAKAIIVFVYISVVGTCNGVILGHTRMPYALAQNDMFFMKKHIDKVNKTFDMPINSAIFAFIVTIVWLFLHYVTQRYNLMPNSDVSEISIIAQYLFYVILYFKVFQLWRKKEIKSWFKGIVIPIFATIGAVFLFIGGFANPLFLFNLGFAVLVVAIAIIYEIKHKKHPIKIEGIEPMINVSEMNNIDISLDILDGVEESLEKNGQDNAKNNDDDNK